MAQGADRVLDRQLRKYLFTSSGLVGVETGVGPDATGPASGSLGLGDLRGP